MHPGQRGQRLPLSGGIDIQRLAAAHAGGTGGVCQRLQAVHAQCCRQWCLGQQAEGAGLQGVPGQDRGGFVEGDVGGGFATAQGIVVHRRQVVVHQRIGMDQFHRHRGRVEPFRLSAEQLASGIDQQRTHALATAEDGMAHGLVQPLRCIGRRGQGGIEQAFDPVAPARERRLSRHGWADRRVLPYRAVPDR